MKFNIREGFSLTLRRVVAEPQPTGKPRSRVEETIHWPGTPIELSERDAIANLHKLEPADKDKDAQAFMNARHVGLPVNA